MNKAHLIITAITLQGLSYRQAAHRFAVTESSRHGDNRVDSQQPINKMLHLGVGREHNKTEVIALIHGLTATVITTSGEVLGDYDINPEKGYQAKK